MAKGARRKRAVIYIRVSRIGDRDRETYQTEEVQEERCRAMAAARGADVIGVYRDIDRSGRSRRGRVGLDQVTALADARAVDLVIVYYVARLGRNLIETLEIARDLQARDVDLISVHEGFDLSTASGRLVFQIMASFAEYESEQRSEAWKSAKAKSMERGVWVGRIPFGYQKAPDGRLEPHPERAAVVAEMFRRRAEGAPIRELARMIDAVKPLPSGLPRSNARTSEIIKNTKYRGSEPLIPRLVSDAAWYAAQQPDAAPKKRSSTHDFFLTGIARCGTCGGSMAGNAFAGQNHATPVYTCSNRSNRGAGACEKGVTILASRLEPWVLEHVQVLDRAVEVKPDAYGRAVELDEQLEAAERELAAYLDDHQARSILGEDRYREHLLGRVEAVEEAREAAALAKAALTAVHRTMAWPDVQGDPDRLRAFLRGRVLSLVVNPGRGKTVDQRCELDLLR